MLQKDRSTFVPCFTLTRRNQLFAVVAAALSFALLSAAPAQATTCAAAWNCANAYAVNAQASYNGSNYTLTAAARTAGCPGFTPDVDNWWTSNGACGGATATATATTARATATATATTARATATATIRATATATATTAATATATTAATATSTPRPTATSAATATATTSGGGAVACWAAWVSTTAYTPAGQHVSIGGRNYENAGWTQGNDPSVAANNGLPGSGAPWIPDLPCGVTPTPLAGPINAVVSSAQFDQIFPHRNLFWNYNGFVAASNSLPAFAGTGSATVKSQEAAAFLANVAHETSGLFWITERQPSAYCDATVTGPCACASGQQYYGRGPLQVSWNYNYCAASQYIYGTGNYTLISSPGILETDAMKSWQASLWYWMTQVGPSAGSPNGAMTAHNAMINNFGFGQTIWAINGSLECKGGNGAQVQDRVNDYTSFSSFLNGVAVQGPTGC